MEELEQVRCHDRLDGDLPFGNFGRGVLDQGEALHVLEVEEQVRDGGYVLDVQIDQ